MRTLVLATANLHKADEIEEILGPGFKYLTTRQLGGAPKVVEDAETLENNARKKALTVAHWLKERDESFPDDACVLADDSGLEVAALDGAPGVRSARFAADEGEGNASDAANNEKLLRLLDMVPDEQRIARFRCVIAIASMAEDVWVFSGVCQGRIVREPRGEGGFGYDPLFQPKGSDQTFAEMGESVKNELSHRASALQQVRRWLSERK